MSEAQYLSAKEAARRLGISRATLYAYVSRGLVRSEPTAGKTRARRYLTADIHRLERRQTVRRDPDVAGEYALNYGAPVLDSALTLIADGRLAYRGHDVMQLAQRRTYEEVAALLWTGSWQPADALFALPPVALPDLTNAAALGTLGRMQAVLPTAEASDLGAYALAQDAVARSGARIVRLLTAAALAEPQTATASVAEQLRRHWRPDDAAAQRLIEAALILCADHELNVSAFAARCVASARGTPYAAVLAGLAALSGTRHGGATQRVVAFFRAAQRDVTGTIRRTLQQGDALPGIHHPLYPDGDPRARLLLALIDEGYARTPGATLARTISTAVAEHLERYPTIDFGLVALAWALDLPEDAPLTLFALGRAAGWIGHCIEQYAEPGLIRPRARYVGPALSPTAA